MNKLIGAAWIAVAVGGADLDARAGEDFVRYVDPLIGSIGEGNTFPGSCYPFGMVQASPDSGERTTCSGYRYKDETIRGFSQTHLNGTGTPAYGDILLQPFTGATGKRTVFPSVYDKGMHDKEFVEGQSVSRTLEYAYNWWCVEKFARLLGNESTAQMANKWANSWKNLFDARVGFMRAKSATGKWREPFDPTKDRQGDAVWGDYTEASAWVYLWHVFQDADGLTELLGGRDATVRKLDDFFSFQYGGDAQTAYWGNKAGIIGMYWHGNEPSHHIPYFYTLLGRRDKCAAIVKKVCDNFYLDKPDGLCGNDDCGQMSAWYIFSMLGFYPFNPAGEDYVLGAAQLPETRLKLPNGKTLRVVSNVKDGNTLKSVSLNGVEIKDDRLPHADLMKGGELVFE